jgi:hypothetical protein
MHGQEYDTCTDCYIELNWATAILKQEIAPCLLHIYDPYYANSACILCVKRHEQILAAIFYRNQIEQPVPDYVVDKDVFLMSFRGGSGTPYFDDVLMCYQPYYLERILKA